MGSDETYAIRLLFLYLPIAEHREETAIGSDRAYRDTPLRERVFRSIAVSMINSVVKEICF